MKTDIQISPSEQEGLVDVNAKEAGISSKDLASALSTLSERLYQDPISAILREITSNAVDANKDNNANRNVEVMITSTEDDYFLSVKDYGKGMSETFMWDNYLQYFDSTKRNSNEMIGGFGIGSKSPFAYTDSFYIHTKCLGEEETRIYLFYKNEKGIPSLVLQEKEESSIFEEGTTIKIPLNDREDSKKFSEVAFRTLFGFPNITSNIFKSPFDQVDDFINTKDYLFFPTYHTCLSGISDKYAYGYNETLNILLGDVLYQINVSKVKGFYSNLLKMFSKIPYMFLRFGIGELLPNPSRESIKLTEESVEVIANKIKSVILEYTFFILDKLKISNLTEHEFKVKSGKYFGFSTAEELKFLMDVEGNRETVTLESEGQLYQIPNSIIKALFSDSTIEADNVFSCRLLTKEIYDSGDSETRKNINLMKNIIRCNSSDRFLHNEFIKFDYKNLKDDYLFSSITHRYYLYMIFTGFVMSSKNTSSFSELPRISDVNTKIIGNWSEFHTPANKEEFLQIPAVNNWQTTSEIPILLKSDISGSFKLCVSTLYSSTNYYSFPFQKGMTRNYRWDILRTLGFDSDKHDLDINLTESLDFAKSNISIIDDKEFAFFGNVVLQIDTLRNLIYSCFTTKKGTLGYSSFKFHDKESFINLVYKTSTSFDILIKSKIVDLFVSYLKLLPEIIFRTPVFLSDVLNLYTSDVSNNYNVLDKPEHYRLIEENMLASYNQNLKDSLVLSSDPIEVRKQLVNVLRETTKTVDDLRRLKRKFYINKYSLKNQIDKFVTLINTQNKLYCKKYIESVCNTYHLLDTPEKTKSKLKAGFENLKITVKNFLDQELEKQRLENEAAYLERLELAKERKKRERKEVIPVQDTKLSQLYIDTPTQSSIQLKRNSDFKSTLAEFIQNVNNLDMTKKAPLAEKEPNYFLYCLPYEVDRIKEFVNSFQFAYTNYCFHHHKCAIRNSNDNYSMPTSSVNFFNSIFVLNEEQIEYIKNEEFEFSKNLLHFDKFVFTIHPFFTLQFYTILKHDSLIRDYSVYSEYVVKPFEKLKLSVPKLKYQTSIVYPVQNEKIIGAVKNDNYVSSKEIEPFRKTDSYFKNEAAFTKPDQLLVKEHVKNRKVLETLTTLLVNKYIPERFSANWLYAETDNLKRLISKFNLHIDYMYFREPDSQFNRGTYSSNRISYRPRLEFPNEETLYQDAIMNKELKSLYLDINLVNNNSGNYVRRETINDNINDVVNLSSRQKLFFLEFGNAYNVYLSLGKICLDEEQFENSIKELEYALSVNNLHYDAYVYIHNICKMIDYSFTKIESDLLKLSPFITLDGSSEEKLITQILTNEKYIHRQQKLVISERHISNFSPEYKELLKTSGQKCSLKIKNKENPLFPKVEDAEKLHIFKFFTKDISLNETKRFISRACNYDIAYNLASYSSKVEKFIKTCEIKCELNLKNSYITFSKLLLPLTETNVVGFSTSDIYPCQLTNDYELSDLVIKRNYSQGSLIKIIYLKGLEAKKKYLKSLKEGDFNKYTKKIILEDDIFYNLSNLDSNMLAKRQIILKSAQSSSVFRKPHKSNLIPNL